MKKFLIKIALFSLPVLALIGGINWYIDPAGLFADNLVERNAAKILISGSSVAGLSNYDERLFQQEWIELLDKTPNTIVLGSSRALLINSSNNGDSTLRNHCVSGARLEDFLAIYQLYNNKNIEPKCVVIEISPYMFNKTYNDTRYQSIEESYNELAFELNLSGQAPSRITALWSEILSLSYFQNAIKSINRPKDSIYATSDTVMQNKSIKDSDGSIVYPLDYQRKGVTPSDIEIALNYGNITPFTVISDQRRNIFEVFVDYLIGKGCKVELFLTPIADEVRTKRPIFIAVEDYINDFATSRKLKLYGSYNASKYNYTGNDFYDGLHPKQEVYDAILKNK